MHSGCQSLWLWSNGEAGRLIPSEGGTQTSEQQETEAFETSPITSPRCHRPPSIHNLEPVDDSYVTGYARLPHS